MHPLLQQYRQIRNELVDFMEKLPVEKWNLTIYEGWTVKDIVAHLSGWAEHQIKCLRLFIDGVKDIPKPKIENKNQESVANRKALPVKKIKDEFITLSENMVKSYESLSDDQWQKPIWGGTKTTPEKFIKIEIKHYEVTHIPELIRLCQ